MGFPVLLKRPRNRIDLLEPRARSDLDLIDSRLGSAASRLRGWYRLRGSREKGVNWVHRKGGREMEKGGR